MTGIMHNGRSATVIYEIEHITNQVFLLFLQNTYGHKAVEPSICRFLADVTDAFLVDSTLKGSPLIVETLSWDNATIEVGVIISQNRQLC